MAETKEGERIYTIPLRGAYQKSMRIRSRYAVDIVRSFLKTHMKTSEVLLGKNLNEAIWERGMKKPPRKVKVSAIKDGDVVKAELFGHKYEEFKAIPKKERKGMKEKMMERLSPLAAKKEAEEKMIEGKAVKTEGKDEVKQTEGKIIEKETVGVLSKEVKAEVKTEGAAPISEQKEEKPADVKPKIAKGKTAKEKTA